MFGKTTCNSTNRHHGLLRSHALKLLVLTCMGLGFVVAGPSGRAAAQIPGGVNASLQASPTSVAAGQVVTFSYSVSPPAVAPPASIISVTISYGDGQSDSGVTGTAGQTVTGVVQHVYSNPGTYPASLTATASNGSSGGDTASVSVSGGASPVQPLPGGVTASLQASPTNVTVGQTVIFTYSATPPAVFPAPSIVTTLVNYGDGQTDLGNPGTPGQTVTGTLTHAYLAPGTYTASLGVSASNGGSGSDTAVVTVVGGGGGGIPGGLNASLQASPTSAVTGQPVTFTYQASPPAVTPPFPGITSVVINYGDGQSDFGNPGVPGQPVFGTFTHAYLVPGPYTATLSVTASNGSSGGDTASVSVFGGGPGPGPVPGAPFVSVQASPSSAAVGQPVSFSYSVSPPAVAPPFPTITNVVLSYGDGQSDFGNTGTSVAGTLTHVYATPGNFTATLTATASNGSTGTSTTSVVISGSVGPSSGVTYAPGWNIVGVPSGTTIPGAIPPFYTYQAGNTAYQTVSSFTAGQGFWVYFNTPVTASLPITGPVTITRAMPPGQYIMIGNPGSSPATVTGADVVYTYNGSAGYQQAAVLPPGQGAWALSFNGGNVTISSGP